ncbi:saccharopine dehydrogenase NADP-binding domain-containing protein [Kocuria turfanensis]|uniref:Saccharopine dehydrogenase n=1 Tax=Kocuria turfanensis TaxID=388357 RepID=A0A512ID98_9MICC|nr:saccharopine dehydrogenase NADP-binding domain-containing protein [Kocuria turfanensis]GEO95670.1 saccharopine dehydrogenase [Kocuria turfanensis]
MDSTQNPGPVVGLLGATGITGRVALAHLVARAPEAGVDVVVGARDPERVRALCAERGIPVPEIVPADVTDPGSLRAFVRRTDVLVNLAGPYTRLAPPVLAACVAEGAHYLDLTGESQLAHRTDRDLDTPARAVGVALVHTAGFEALPADVLVDAARRHAAARGETLRTADLVTSVRTPPGTGFSESASGGTLQSLVEVLRDPDPARMGDVAARLPAPAPGTGTAADPGAVRRTSPLRLRARTAGGRVLAPMSPLAAINPPVVHRTQALSPVPGAAAHPLAFREAADLGRSGGLPGAGRFAAATAVAVVQFLVGLAGRLPHPVRARLADVLAARLPQAGTGPTGDVLTGWSWTTRGVFTTHQGSTFPAVLEAQGNPGYGTTPWLTTELALRMAVRGVPEAALGSSTPALALDGDLDALLPARVRTTVG